jgi:hypothetical protein
LRLSKNHNLVADLKNLFKDEVYEPLKAELIDSFLNLMDSERREQIIDFAVLKNFVNFMNTIDLAYMETLYSTELEQRVVETSSLFYQQIVQSEFLNKNYIDYLHWCHKIITNEDARLANYLTTATIAVIIKNLKNILYFQNSKTILETADSFKTLLLKGDIKVNKNFNLGIKSDIFNFLRG